PYPGLSHRWARLVPRGPSSTSSAGRTAVEDGSLPGAASMNYPAHSFRPAVVSDTYGDGASVVPSRTVERWTPVARLSVAFVLLGQVLLALAPLFLEAGAVDRLTTLFIYGILALMWNALAGY